MRVTIEMPDDVHMRAKARAAELGVPLRQYATEALEEKIRLLEALDEAAPDSGKA